MSFINIQYHIVFSTKERRAFLKDPDTLRRTCEYFGGIVREMGCAMLAANGTANHVHIATTGKAAIAVSDFVRAIKTNSSAWVHKTFPDLPLFRWQDGYAAFTVSPSTMPRVVAYVRGQAEHHKKMTFEEELILLLDKHGIEYDERYVFD